MYLRTECALILEKSSHLCAKMWCDEYSELKGNISDYTSFNS